MIICGDALTELRKLPDESVTSPRLRWMVDGLNFLIQGFAELDDAWFHRTPTVLSLARARFIFAFSQGKNGAGLFFFNRQVRQEFFNGICRAFIAGLVAIKRAFGIFTVLSFMVVVAAQCFAEEFYGWFIYHPNLNPFVILGIDTIGPTFGFFNAYISFPVNQPGQISNQFVLSHKSLIPRKRGDVK